MDNVNQIASKEKMMLWISEIEHNTNRFKEEFSACSEEQLLYKPSKDSWSIAENIQHVIEVNRSYFPIFSQLLTRSYRPSWSSRFTFINNLFGRLILKSVNEDRKKKIKTFPLWIPNKLAAVENILSEFESHQKELISWIHKLEPYIGVNTIINSPANKLISYTLDDAIDIIAMHEKRHLNQAIEVKLNNK
jgi:hypothetical protein